MTRDMYISDRRLYNTLQLALDCLCFELIWAWSIEFRVLLNPLLPAKVNAAASMAWTPPMLLILPLWLALSFRWRLYRTPEQIRCWTLLLWALETSVWMTAVAAVVTFFSREFGHLVSRMFVPTMLLTSVGVLFAGRIVGFGIMALFEKTWGRRAGVALLGNWTKARGLVQRLEAHYPGGIRGIIVPDGALEELGDCPLPVLGTTGQITDVINRERLNRVIVLDASLPSKELTRCTQVLGRMGVALSCVVDIASDPVRLDLSTYSGMPFVEMAPVQFTRGQQIVKRFFDLILSLVSLAVLGPLMLAIAVLIKLTSKGPVLYTSQRVGKGGRYFTFLKFRSMYTDSEHTKVAQANEKGGHIFKMRNDPRVTPVGRVLRRYSLDELPQLINVLRGDMSIVGPRPLPAGDLEPDGMSKQFAAWAEGRSSVHPGLTGLWQISGRSDLGFDDMVRLDLTYIENWSLGLDLKIIVDTPMLVLRGVGAY
jgi:exopolysaccharide biosynthesis polyprenyl glycosylphosphotransferase